ncbi:MAG: hypothetical protein KAT74_04320, partial [Candidatus Cloacimonetes bacterium]|nr:hypothetical protein [Candidatus Cloacimonadota bacterium]
MNKKILFILVFLCLISVLFSQNFEGFESGNFYTYNWQFSGNADWIIIASNPYEGLYCAQAGDIDHDEISTLSIIMETTFIGDISFYWRVNSQSSCDNLVFYIDGDEVENISGSQDWELYSLSIQPGNHTFAWSYEKDSSITSGLDTGWIDNITFPPTTTFDNDLAALLITGPGAVYSGNSAIYNILVKNYGNNPQGNYTVKLYREGGIELDVLNVTETLESEEEITHNLVWIVPPDEPAAYTYVYGEVILAGDEDLSNNTTDILNVMILEIGLIEIRVGYGTHQTNWYPLNFYFCNSLSETIYFPSEIYYTGVIHAISYENNFDSYITNTPTKIWMGETTQSTLTNGWISASSLNDVFDGTVTYPSGINTVMIPLD